MALNDTDKPARLHLEDAAFEAYSAWPERIYILSPDDRIHYKGGPGPSAPPKAGAMR